MNDDERKKINREYMKQYRLHREECNLYKKVCNICGIEFDIGLINNHKKTLKHQVAFFKKENKELKNINIDLLKKITILEKNKIK